MTNAWTQPDTETRTAQEAAVETTRLERIVIEGGHPLHGSLAAPGSKNAALPMMAACLLARGDTVLRRVPDISDVRVMTRILRAIGVRVQQEGPGVLRINTDHISTTTAPYELVRKMNASFDVAGPLLARHKEMEVALPGGCNLGARPVNLHIEGFRQLGADVTSAHGYVQARCNKLVGTSINLPMVSVGATKNLMMAATLAEGTTVLHNVAREPEVVALGRLLNAMGAHIEGLGTSMLTIHGVSELVGVEQDVVSDRIGAGTYLVGAAITRGDLTVENIDPLDIDALIHALQDAGQDVHLGESSVRVRGRRPAGSLHLQTAPFPGFPTDLQPIIVSLLSLADGTSTVVETIFDGRFMYTNELNRLGADLRVTDRTILVRGVSHLTGAPVEAPDIRAGGAIILAGLAAEGETSVGGVEFIDRGYERIEETLQSVGARIRRVQQGATGD